MTFNESKFKTLVHYICAKCEDSSKTLGATKLHRILYYSDFDFYASTGAPMTGERYVRRRHGPAPVHILPILGELESEGKLDRRQHKDHGVVKAEYRALDIAPDLHQFTVAEIALVDTLVDVICPESTASPIHDENWERVKLGEDLPYR